MEMRGWLKASPERLKTKIVELAIKVKNLARDDPRRVIHALKVGLAITLMSLFYYFEPLYGSFGVSAMWTLLTVVVVFEFSVGATLGKGLNRGLATLFAGGLGLGAHRLACLAGDQGEPILIGVFVFLLATTVTFVRFFPRMKARYDYGLLMFILTFCLISVSGFRNDELLNLAHKRATTIFLGGLAAVFICIFICPVWAGDDLHNLVATNIQKLGCFLECFSVGFFQSSGEEALKQTSFPEYKSILNLKNTEESLTNFARWEPPHGRFRFRHPWKHYLKIGCLTRECAYKVDALNGYLNMISCNIEKPSEIQGKIREVCKQMSFESGKALIALGRAIKKMAPPSSANLHIELSKNEAKNLEPLLKTSLRGEDIDLHGIVPLVSVASLLVEVVSCTEKLAESVHELAFLAHFKNVKSKVEQQEESVPDKGEMQKVSDGHISNDHAIAVE